MLKYVPGVNNLSRQSHKYGDLHFISFLSAILSRLAYFNDNKFLRKYNSIMGPVILPKIMQAINNVDSNNLEQLLNDEEIFELNGTSTDMFVNYEYTFNNKKFIDFIGLNMPQNVNIINEDLQGNLQFPLGNNETEQDQVKYISIAWSNYGEIYIVADKRMPNTIFVIFRGTYSAKTASLYLKPTSITPLKVCNDSQGFLYGIFKVSSEMIHTIVESIRYLATNFLCAKIKNSIKIFTTGHSLGGAMCTNFAYLWNGIKKTAPYNTCPYSILSENIICVSLGAPRGMNSSVAAKFCKLVEEKKILYLRITTNGDPVPASPPKLLGVSDYQHPCSDNDNMRKYVSESCAPQLQARPSLNINYNGNLDCLNYKARTYIPNFLSHTVYLDILFTKAVDIVNYLKGLNPVGTTREINRSSTGSTVCRLITGNNNKYKAVFFDVNQVRQTSNQSLSNSTSTSSAETNKKSSLLKIGGKVFEDVKISLTIFNKLILEMKPLTNDLSPLKGDIFNLSNETMNIMPDLSCPELIVDNTLKNSTGCKKSKYNKKYTSKKFCKKYKSKNSKKTFKKKTFKKNIKAKIIKN